MWSATLYSRTLIGWIETLLTSVLLENVNTISNGNWFRPVEPVGIDSEGRHIENNYSSMSYLVHKILSEGENIVEVFFVGLPQFGGEVLVYRQVVHQGLLKDEAPLQIVDKSMSLFLGLVTQAPDPLVE